MITTALHHLLDLSASRFPGKLALYPLASVLSLFNDCLCAHADSGHHKFR